MALYTLWKQQSGACCDTVQFSGNQKSFSKPFWELAFNCLGFNSDQNIFPHNQYRCGELHGQLVEPLTCQTPLMLCFVLVARSELKYYWQRQRLLWILKWEASSEMVWMSNSPESSGVTSPPVIGSLALYFLSSSTDSVKLHWLSLSEKNPKIYI